MLIYTIIVEDYFYPRSPCGERPYYICIYHTTINISIHALLAESDLAITAAFITCKLFLSTLSQRRATKPCKQSHKLLMYFYPRSPCGERHCTACQFEIIWLFLSTLSLRRATYSLVTIIPSNFSFLSTLSLRRATTDMRQRLIEFRFLSTLSLRRATLRVLDGSKSSIISIHALLAESDDTWQRGSRITYVEFLSTLSLRRATHYDNYNLHCVEISIHALLAESDKTHQYPDESH